MKNGKYIDPVSFCFSEDLVIEKECTETDFNMVFRTCLDRNLSENKV